MTSPLLRLTVQRSTSEHQQGERHVCLIVRPEAARVIDGNGDPLVAGFDPDKPDAWRGFYADALEVAGMLARLALDVLPELQLTGSEHGCDWQPQRGWRANDAHPDVIRATSVDGVDTCGIDSAYLGADEPIGDSGYMPRLMVYVPRNRERAWCAYLLDKLAVMTRSTADAFAWIDTHQWPTKETP